MDFSEDFSCSQSISLLECYQKCQLSLSTTTFLHKLASFKPSCSSTCNENTIPMAYITSITEHQNECQVFTHQIKWKKQSSKEDKLHYKFSDGKQASFWDPGHSFLLGGACCQHHVKGTVYSSASWHAWERLHHHLLQGTHQEPIPINIWNWVQLNSSFILFYSALGEKQQVIVNW